jgi:hypothetical protein
MWLEAGKAYVQKLRAAPRTRDPLGARISIQTALASIDLQPPGLPRSAILCVRKLHSRCPPVFRNNDTDLGLLSRWREEVLSSLDNLARHATRPAREPVTGEVEAVLFADHAELLACLALHWCDGVINDHWWWSELFPGGMRPQSWATIWLQHPEYIPAAVDLVTQIGRLSKLALSVTSTQAELLLNALADRFDLWHIRLSLERAKVDPFLKRSEPPTGEIRLATDFENALPRPERTQAPDSDFPAEPPWRPWIPNIELPDDLGSREQCFFGFALTLMRAPRVARSAAFAKEISAWIDAPRRRSKESGRGIGISPAGGTGALPTAAVDSHFRDVRVAPESFLLQVAPVPFRSAIPPDLPKPLQPHIHEHVYSVFSSGSDKKRQVIDHSPSADSHGQPSDSERAGMGIRNLEPLIASNEHSEGYRRFDSQKPHLRSLVVPEVEIDTELGGIFYLVNVALLLGLYGDFTAPRRPGLELSVWDFLVLCGQELVGVDWSADPLWPLLAKLAGREKEEDPGTGFEPPDHWHLPAEWLESFPEALAWRWVLHADRLRVCHPAGFTIVDIPVTCEKVEAQMQRALAHYPRASCLESLQFQDSSPPLKPLDRWVDWLCGYLRARLPRALGFPARSHDALTLLLNEPAHIVAAPSEISVFFSLALHPIETRLAGLDRDPGWVPATGRTIAFYYE